MAEEVCVAYVSLVPSAEGFGAAAAKAISGGVTAAADKAASAVTQRFNQLGDDLTKTGTSLTLGLTLPIAGFGAATLNAAGDFEAGMKRVGVLTGATAEEFAQLDALARELGRTTMFTATDAAGALNFLAMAGFNAQQAMTALPGVLNLAAAGQLDLATTADIASNVLTGFGLQASDITRVTDVMAQTMTRSNTNMEQLGEAMSYAAPTAAAAGMSFEEAAAAIGILGNAGIQASRAGTSLGGAIVRLLDPAPEAAEVMERLGINAKDAGGNLLPLVDIVDQFGRTGATVSDIMTVFGLRAGPAMSALVSQGADALRDLTQKNLESSGRAAEIATVAMEGFNGGMLSLKSAFEGLQLAIADAGLLKWATDAANAMANWVRQVAQTNPQMLRMGTIVAGIAAAIGPLLIIVGKIVPLFGGLTGATGSVAVALRGLGAAARFLLGPWGLLIGLLVTAFTQSEDFRNAIMGLLGTLVDVGGGIIQALMPAIQSILDAVLPLIVTLADALAPLIGLVAKLLVPVAQLVGWLIELATKFLIGPAVEILAAAIGLLVEGISALVGWLSRIDWAGVWQSIVDGVGGFFSAIGTFFHDLPGNIGQWLQDLPGTLQRNAQEAMAKFTYAIGFGIGLALGFIRDMPGRVAEFLSSLPDKAVAAVLDLWPKLVRFFTDTSTNVQTSIQDGITNWLQEMAAFPGKVIDVLSGLPGQLADFGIGLINAMWSLGRDIVFGAIDGIKSAVGGIGTALHDGFTNALNGVKAGLGIHSPSTVYMEIGEQTIAGYVAGVDQSAQDAAMATTAALSPAATGAAPAVAPRPITLGSSDPLWQLVITQLREQIRSQYDGDPDLALASL